MQPKIAKNRWVYPNPLVQIHEALVAAGLPKYNVLRRLRRKEIASSPRLLAKTRECHSERSEESQQGQSKRPRYIGA